MKWIPRHCRTSRLKKLRRAKARRKQHRLRANSSGGSRLIMKQRGRNQDEFSTAQQYKKTFKGIAGALSWRDMARMIIGKVKNRERTNRPRPCYVIMNNRGKPRLFNGRMDFRKRNIDFTRLQPEGIGQMQG